MDACSTHFRRYLSMLLVMLMTVSAAAVICTKNAYAGSFSGGYISLGADLTEDEKSKGSVNSLVWMRRIWRIIKSCMCN